VGRFARPETYRSAELAADLAALGMDNLAMLPAGEAYAGCVRRAAEADGTALIGHAYTRTLGDLSGGQIMRRLLGRSLNLGDATLGFYHFGGIGDIAAYKAGYHAELDLAGTEIAEPGRVLEAAVLAFQLNIDVSAAVAAMDAGAE
jgi:heme oxygenase